MIELDRDTVHKAARGDSQAFRSLYDHYAPQVWRIVYRTAGGQESEAREIVQDTFIRVHKWLRKFSFASSLSTWIYRIAFNAAMSKLGKRARVNGSTVEFNDQSPGPYRSDVYEDRELVRRILDELSPEDRFLLTAREIDDIDFGDLAAITGSTAGALRTRLHRIKEGIRGRFPEMQAVGG